MRKENLNKSTLRVVHLVSFLIGFGQAILIYVMSTYFKDASGTENVGIFYLVAYVVELVVLFNLHKLVSNVGHTRAFLFIIFAKIPFLAILAVVNPSVYGILAMVFYVTFGNIAWICMDMIMESCSIDRLSGRIRGLHLTILNAGFLLGPFISTKILDKFGFHGVFVSMVVLYSVIFIVALIGLRKFYHPVVRRSTMRQVFAKVAHRKNILRIYYVSYVLEFFYALMVMYTPIYLLDLGLSWDKIGIIFTVMLVPFVLFEYPVGYFADKELGEKELIILSLAIMGFSTLSVYFTKSTSVLVWATLLFSTRVGASFLEILRDSYFYKRIGADDIDLIDFFRTTRPIAYITGAVISTFFIFLFPLKVIFLIISLVVISAIIPAWKLVDNKSERELIGG